jgi:hypothetical protein
MSSSHVGFECKKNARLYSVVVWILFFHLASCVFEWSEESLGRKGGKRKQGRGRAAQLSWRKGVKI